MIGYIGWNFMRFLMANTVQVPNPTDAKSLTEVHENVLQDPSTWMSIHWIRNYYITLSSYNGST